MSESWVSKNSFKLIIIGLVPEGVAVAVASVAPAIAETEILHKAFVVLQIQRRRGGAAGGKTNLYLKSSGGNLRRDIRFLVVHD